MILSISDTGVCLCLRPATLYDPEEYYVVELDLDALSVRMEWELRRACLYGLDLSARAEVILDTGYTRPAMPYDLEVLS